MVKPHFKTILLCPVRMGPLPPCRWCCSMHVASLCEVAQAMEAQARGLEKEAKSSSKSSKSKGSKKGGSKKGESGREGKEIGAGDVTARAAKAVRVLRVLITAFNAFLRRSSRGSRIYSTT